MYLILFIYQKRIQAQNNSSLSRNWVVGISPAVASCYGDLTQYDYDPYNKVIHESGPAVGLFAGKKINKILEVGLVATFGRTSGSQNNADIRFKNSFNEIGVYSGLNLAKILIPTQNSAIDYGIIAKYSITNYRAASYHISDNSVIASYGLNAAGNKSGNKESSLHFGGGYFFSYALNSRYTVQMSQIFQFLTTDKFDAFVGSTGVNDRLLLSTISLKYTIRPSQSAKIDLLECPTF
jgi:hypothetical protein